MKSEEYTTQPGSTTTPTEKLSEKVSENLPEQLSAQLDRIIEQNHLLKHPFYQAWVSGDLNLKTLDYYASQYSHHVEAFPRYLSRVHSNTESSEARQILLENLIEEEGIVHGKDHPTLWRQFSQGLQKKLSQVKSSEASTKQSEKPEKQHPRELNTPSACTSVTDLVSTFRRLVDDDPTTGLAAIYTYESMVPEVASSKIEGLSKNYNISDESTLEFFKVHQLADIEHRQALRKVIDKIPESDSNKAKEATAEAGQALWNFLSEMEEYEKQFAS